MMRAAVVLLSLVLLFTSALAVGSNEKCFVYGVEDNLPPAFTPVTLNLLKGSLVDGCVATFGPSQCIKDLLPYTESGARQCAEGDLSGIVKLGSLSNVWSTLNSTVIASWVSVPCPSATSMHLTLLHDDTCNKMVVRDDGGDGGGGDGGGGDGGGDGDGGDGDGGNDGDDGDDGDDEGDDDDDDDDDDDNNNAAVAEAFGNAVSNAVASVGISPDAAAAIGAAAANAALSALDSGASLSGGLSPSNPQGEISTDSAVAQGLSAAAAAAAALGIDVSEGTAVNEAVSNAAVGFLSGSK